MEGEIMYIVKTWMEGEVKNFIKVWCSAFLSLSYCYSVGKFVPQGRSRLLTLFPVICLYLALPLNLHSMHLCGITALFIAWLSNFKLLMFAFGIGPLSHPLSLLQFLVIGSLPINPSLDTHFENPSSNGNFKENPSSDNNFHETLCRKKIKQGLKSPQNYATKALLVGLLVRVYDYSEYIHPTILLFLFTLHIYLLSEVMMAAVVALAQAILRIELEPPFNDPYLSSSLQDFWGNRWNIVVTRILRPSVYNPSLRLSARVFGRKWAPLPAVLATFMVSAVMHELIFYYLGRARPTWTVTWFFLLHGVSLIAEIAIKKAVKGRLRLPVLISGPLTIMFVLSTGVWLFLPDLLKFRADARALEEYTLLSAFLKDVGRVLTTKWNVAKA